jgi:poly(3-hydroxybutyrate) depolymerase
VRGDGDSAEKHREFYDEYLAVMDLTAEFYLQTVDRVFIQHLMPRGLMTHRNRRIDLGAIRRVALMTVEGEADDITGIGQCRAALDLCSAVPRDRKQHYVCPKVGHYGIFNGARFRREIAPRIAAFVRANDPCTETGFVMPLAHHGTVARRGFKVAHNPASLAFTFKPSNDEALDGAVAGAHKPAVRGGAAGGERSSLATTVGAGLVPWRLWQATGQAVMHALTRFPFGGR